MNAWQSLSLLVCLHSCCKHLLCNVMAKRHFHPLPMLVTISAAVTMVVTQLPYHSFATVLLLLLLLLMVL